MQQSLLSVINIELSTRFAQYEPYTQLDEYMILIMLLGVRVSNGSSNPCSICTEKRIGVRNRTYAKQHHVVCSIFVPIFKEGVMNLDYVITNPNKKVYIRLNENGSPETCSKQIAQRFEFSKAKNICGSLPKSLRKFHFKVEAIPEEITNKEIERVEEKENCLHCIELTKWKHGCDGYK